LTSFAGQISFTSGTVATSYSTGNASGSSFVGGFVGYNVSGTAASAVIAKDYSTGQATGVTTVGGFAGYNGNAIIDSVYATGATTLSNPLSSNPTGGLVAQNGSGTWTNSYWDVQSTGQGSGVSGTGYSTVQMQTQSNFAGWDFTNVWQMPTGGGYPQLRLGWDFTNVWQTVAGSPNPVLRP